MYCSGFHNTGALYENDLCPYVLRLHSKVTSKDLLDEHNDLAGTYMSKKMCKLREREGERT